MLADASLLSIHRELQRSYELENRGFSFVASIGRWNLATGRKERSYSGWMAQLSVICGEAGAYLI